MERMGEILARNATRHARLRSAANGATRAPAERGGDAGAPAGAQPPHASGEPPADVLPTERILELPRRMPKAPTRVEASSAGASVTLPAANPTYAHARETEARPVAPARQRRPSGAPAVRPASATTRSMTPLRDLAQPYLAKRPAQSGIASAARATGRTGVAKKPSAASTAPDVCPRCGGVGYLRLDVPVTDIMFGKAIPCECTLRAEDVRRRAELLQMSSISAFDAKTFDSFDSTIPGVQEAFLVARDYAISPIGWLLVMGGYGTGKTHLAAAIANHRLAEGAAVYFSVVPDLLDHLRSAFGPSSEAPYDEVVDRVRKADLLVLDDLGAENSTAWATEKLFQLINYRYNYRLATVITTNNRLLERMDERIRSRLSDLSLVRHVRIEAADYRERRAGRAPRASGGGSSQRGRS
jgi:DNA replication protein DnaC